MSLRQGWGGGRKHLKSKQAIFPGLGELFLAATQIKVSPSALGKTKKAKVTSLGQSPLCTGSGVGDVEKGRKGYLVGKVKLKITQSDISLTWGKCGN